MDYYTQHSMGERRLHHTEMRQKSSLRESFFSLRDDRTMSVATEFVDMDWDEGIISDGEDSSPRHSVNSSGGQPSITTLSSYDEAPTPKHSPSRRDVDADWSHAVEGPTGPHLFGRNSLIQTLEDNIVLSMSPITPKTAYPMDEAFNLPIFHEPLPLRRPSSEPFAFHYGHLDASDLIDWTPEMVAQSMLDAGMEQAVAERFVENDISGAILMTLKFEDLKELSIQSFGIRTKVWAQVQALRDSRPSSPRVPTPIQDEPSREVRREARTPPEEVAAAGGPKRARSTRRRPARTPSHDDIISPLESVSIVGIEQVIPEPHFCSKGEKCSTYKKRQRIIEEVRRLNPNADLQSGTVVISGDPGNPLTARALDPHEMIRPFSEANNSVVASSDVMGPGSAMNPLQYIQAATLRSMQHQDHDPQENVRQFLSFQQCASNEVPPTPPFEMLPSSMAPKQGLRTLPKLSIPGPSRLAHQVSVTPEAAASPPAQKQQQQQQHVEDFVPYQMDKADPLSPDLQIRNPYRFGTPFSEMDVPVTMVPLDRVERNVSQSVPPEMNYHAGNAAQNPPQRAMSRASARRPSFPVMPAVDENTTIAPRHSPQTSSPQRVSAAVAPRRQQQPSQAPPRAAYPWSQQASVPVRHAASSSTGSLADATATAASSSTTSLPNGVTYAGHMKKRRTRMLRTEWNDGYFTLKGTRLAMHKDAVTLDRSLEYVDIDDYAIACSSLASQSKLSAAFKRMHILSGSSGAKDTDSVGAFAFQLVPQNGVPSSKLRKRESGFSFSQSSSNGPDGANGTGKTHHFAVRNKDERIDWMRELMLAKALRQKGEGFEVNVNGTQF